MFLAEITNDESLKKAMCSNLIALMAMGDKISDVEKEQIKSILAEAKCSIGSVGLDMLSDMDKNDVQDNIKKMLDEHDDFANNEANKRKFLFELVACALCDGEYDNDEKEVIESVRKAVGVDEAGIEEMKDIVKTLFALNKRSENLIFSERI